MKEFRKGYTKENSVVNKIVLKKNPCPDCTFCQYCSNTRCSMCLPRERKKDKEEKKRKEKVHIPLFRRY